MQDQRSIQKKGNRISFALANAIVGYLDEKQHIERVNPDLDHIGWYKKTNFIIRAVIGGDEFAYDGRIDIGDGLAGNAATLVNHIKAYNEYVLEKNPYHFSEKQIEAFRRNVEILVPFLEQHTELTAEEQKIFEQFKADYPIPRARAIHR